MLAGYMRVSSDSDQTTDLQRDALLSAGVGSRHLTNLAAGDTSVGSTPGCGGMSQNETTGTLVGGAAGAVIGNQFGKGGGKTVATAIGAILGATVGREIGASLDETSRREAGEATHRALETADVGAGITWDNPANAGAPAKGSTVITRQGAGPTRQNVPGVSADGHDRRQRGPVLRNRVS